MTIVIYILMFLKYDEVVVTYADLSESNGNEA